MKDEKLPHRISLEEFRLRAVVKTLVNHGRQYEVFFRGKSLGFADGEDPVGFAHQREVNNALYCCTKDAPDFMRGGVLPSLSALQSYPSLLSRFPREHFLASVEPDWTPEYAAKANEEGWDLFDASGEAQIQRQDDQGLLSEDAEAWRIVMTGNEDHHIIARTIVYRDSPQEWERIRNYMENGAKPASRHVTSPVERQKGG